MLHGLTPILRGSNQMRGISQAMLHLCFGWLHSSYGQLNPICGSQMPFLGAFLQEGYPQIIQIFIGFPRNKPSSYLGTPMTMETPK